MDFKHLPSLIPANAIASLSASFLFLFVYFLVRNPRASSRTRTPPEAGGSWPIIGHLHLLSGPEPPFKTLSRMAEKYGPIFTIRMGVHRALVVSSWELAKECFTTNDKVFANRPKSVATEVLTYNYAMFGFGPYGPYWRQARKIATLELLSNHRLETLSHVRQSEIKTGIEEIYELCVKNKDNQVEMKKWFGDVTLNLLFRMIVGKRYLEATSSGENCKNPEFSRNDGSRSEQCRKALRDFFEYTGTFVVSDALPWLRWLDLGGYEKAMKRTAKELDELAEVWLEEHKRKRVNNGGREVVNKGDEHDFMDVMLSILDDAELGVSGYDADTINKALSLTLILAATDTTTVTMTWALALLLNNPDA
ncbi:Cytochrome P450, E-class, group I [Parasponia andersonii]|uniref:Cytochrome P450, E-class, group I n=1 Tax=Parasponia andersonii TaxID=3476 RepID=A0A2P5DA43_PARAD|nr:Cytochrome P450, E-class, group I [Parasponia andersonii]